MNNGEIPAGGHEPHVLDVGRLVVEGQVNEGDFIMSTADQEAACKSLYEKSKAEAEIISAGSLRSLAGEMRFKGGISLESRMASGEITEEILEKATQIYSESFVAVGDNAAMRCGDGRSEEGSDGLTKYQLAIRQLGPQSMGGVQSYATAYRTVAIPKPDATLLEDIEVVRDAIILTGSEVGMHTDEHSDTHAHGKTGCGAFNNISNGVEMYNSDDDQGATILASNVIGDEYRTELHERSKLNVKDIPENYSGDGAQILEELNVSYGEKSNQVYTGDHNEGFAGVNNVPGTTFNRELFNRRCKEELGLDIQAFSIDAWKFHEVAEELFKGDETMQQAYLTAMGDWQARPAVFITDGSQRVLVRNPS